jgi:hypothetical protein
MRKLSAVLMAGLLVATLASAAEPVKVNPLAVPLMNPAWDDMPPCCPGPQPKPIRPAPSPTPGPIPTFMEWLDVLLAAWGW